MKNHSGVQLTDQAVLEQAEAKLAEISVLPDPESSKWDKQTVIDVLLQAAVTRSSIEAVCKTLNVGVSSNTIRTYLNQALSKEHFGDLEREVNRVLGQEIPRPLRNHKLQIAIDCHDESFYGKGGDLNELCCGGEAKDGTTRFVRIATAYVIYRNLRLTLAVLFVRPEDRLAEIVASLLRRLRRLGLSFKCIYCDRGFCSIPILQAIAEMKIPAILACPIRGKTKGTRRLCQGSQSYMAQHTFKSQQYGHFTASLAVVPCQPSRKRRSKKKNHDRQYCLFVLLHCSPNPDSILRLYKNRFGIESSYRSLRQVKAFTSSSNTLFRFFCLSLALLLVNLWTILRFLFIQDQRSFIFSALAPNILPFYCITSFISHSITRLFGTISSTRFRVANFSC